MSTALVDSEILYRVTHPEMRNDRVSLTTKANRRAEVFVDNKGQARQFREQDDGLMAADPRIDEDIAEHLALVGWHSVPWTFGDPELLIVDPVSGHIAGYMSQQQGANMAEVLALKERLAEVTARLVALESRFGKHEIWHATNTIVGPIDEEFEVTAPDGQTVTIETVQPPMPRKPKAAKSKAQEEDEAEAPAPIPGALDMIPQG